MDREPDRLTQSWSRVDPRYSDESAISAQMIRSAQESRMKGRGWIGCIACQIAFILFFFLPGLYFFKMGWEHGWNFGVLFSFLLPTTIGSLLTWFIWKNF